MWPAGVANTVLRQTRTRRQISPVGVTSSPTTQASLTSSGLRLGIRAAYHAGMIRHLPPPPPRFIPRHAPAGQIGSGTPTWVTAIGVTSLAAIVTYAVWSASHDKKEEAHRRRLGCSPWYGQRDCTML